MSCSQRRASGPEGVQSDPGTGPRTPTLVNGEVAYSALDVRVAAHSRALLSRGVEARHLGTLRRVAEREIGVVDDFTYPLRQVRTEYSREQVLAITAEVAREVAALRAVLTERELGVTLR